MNALKVYFVSLLLIGFVDYSVANKNILCLGDSLTREGSWIYYVSNSIQSYRKENITFINGGKNGRKSNQLMYPFRDKYMKQYKLDGLILFIGVNDLNNLEVNSLLFNKTLAFIMNNVSAIIEDTRVLFGPNNILLLAPCDVNRANMSSFAIKHGYNSSGCAAGLKFLHGALEKIALKLSINFLSLYNKASLSNIVDGVHLSEQGYKQIGEAISEKIKTAGIFL